MHPRTQQKIEKRIEEHRLKKEQAAKDAELKKQLKELEEEERKRIAAEKKAKETRGLKTAGPTSFKKGQSGNPLGRPKQLTDEQIIDIVRNVYKNRMEKIDKDLDQMSPFQRVQVLFKLGQLYNLAPVQEDPGAQKGPMKITVTYGEPEQKTIDIPHENA